MKPLDAMLSAHMTPALRPHGFRKTGRTYRIAAPNGTQGLINFESRPMSLTRTDFFVNVDVVVEAQRDWLAFALDVELTKQPAAGQGFWQDRVWPPEDVEDRSGEFRSQLWFFDDDEGAARCGRHLTRIFTEETVPFLKRMLDRREQLAALRDPSTPSQRLQLGTNHLGEIILLVDDGPSPALDAALAEAERQGNHKVAVWAQDRLRKLSQLQVRQ